MSKFVGAADPAAERSRSATRFTQELNKRYTELLPFDDRRDYEDAARGAVELMEDLVITDKQGRTVWSMKAYAFEKQQKAAPDTVNPSLWRQAQLNSYCGLFKVEEGFYQVRGFDLGNMSIVEGPTGIVIIDPLLSSECAYTALQLYYKHRGQKPVKAVIYSHSHAHHYGGVLGVCTKEQVESGDVTVIAAKSFLAQVCCEGAIAGVAMKRRGQYSYGAFLPKGEIGQIDCGVGKTQSTGTVGLIRPTMTIKEHVEKHRIAGVDVHFVLTPGTETTSEMCLYFPTAGVLCAAESVTHNLHSVLSLQGGTVVDALTWSKYLDEICCTYVPTCKVLFGQHGWPVWSKERIGEYVADQRDMYRFMHDQTMRLVNKGYSGVEIAEDFQLPPDLAKKWYCRGYSGSVSQNVKAIYQRYMGWFESHPADVWALPPVKVAAKYIELMGGADRVIEHAERAYQEGDYRWTAEVLRHVVYCDPRNAKARTLQASAFEQLGYCAESGAWRNYYLCGAEELREGVKNKVAPYVSADVVAALQIDQIFDYLGVQINGPMAWKQPEIVVNWQIADQRGQEEYALMRVRYGALSYQVQERSDKAACTVKVSRPVLAAMVCGQLTPQAAVQSGQIQVEGNVQSFYQIWKLRDVEPAEMPVVTAQVPYDWKKQTP